MENYTDYTSRLFWDAVNTYQRELLQGYNAESTITGDYQICEATNKLQPNLYSTKPNEFDEKEYERTFLLKEIEQHVVNIIDQLVKNETVMFSYQNMHKWTNIMFEETHGLGVVEDCSSSEIKFDHAVTARRFGLLMKILDIVYRLVQADSYSTKRDMYYGNVELFGKQCVVDDLVTCVACMLGVSRWRLHVLATSKGCVSGDLRYYERGVFVDCNTGSTTLVPTHVKAIKNISTNARFVLIVEKDATFQKLLDQAFCRKFGPCILVTGKGFPDVNTRMLLRRLWDEQRLPMFALVDADPHGIEIFFIYKYGSKTLAQETQHLAVPTIRWIGVFPSDIHRFKLPDAQLLEMTPVDRRKADSLLKRPYILNDQPVIREIETLLRSGKKAEIQSLIALSSTFLTDVYLPAKLQHTGWI